MRGAIDALESQDVELCDEVIAYDDEIDDRYHAIERSIEQLLAQQAPVATDLRLVLAVLHNSIHLERIGDQSVTIAKLTKLSATSSNIRARGRAPRDGRCAPRRWFGSRSTRSPPVTSQCARSLVDLDELIDRTNRRVVDKVLAMSRDPEATQEWGMRMIVVSRCLERIGDNAVDIGEQTEFLVTGEFHEFTDASH